MTTVYLSSTLSAHLKKPLGWQFQLCLLGLVIFAADFFLFQGEHLGITVPLFLLVLGLASLVSRWQTKKPANGKIAIPVLLAGLLPLIETFNTSTTIVGVTGTLAAIAFMHGYGTRTPLTLLTRLLRILVTIPKRVYRDSVLLQRLRRLGKPVSIRARLLNNWVIPIVMTLGFLWLFASANPLIANWIGNIDLSWVLNFLDFKRIFFWFCCIVLCWPLIRLRLKRSQIGKQEASRISPDAATGSRRSFLNPAQVVRALVLFNALFAIQSVLDIAYLWGSGELPSGVTHAEYVHRGTYTLLFAVLLAAAFMLIVTGKSRGSQPTAGIHFLLLVWAGQNMFMVISTMKRMQLYIDAYALTYLRVAALIWMLLVAIGLCLIVVRLYKKYSNNWLINANLVSLALVLYTTSLVNMPWLIAEYNVNRALENPKNSLDIAYLARLGENAIPAIDRARDFAKRLPQNNKYLYQWHNRALHLASKERRLVVDIRHAQQDWRQWSFRRARLAKYVDNRAKNSLKVNDADTIEKGKMQHSTNTGSAEAAP